MVNLETWETTNFLTPIKSSIREILVSQKTYFGFEIFKHSFKVMGYHNGATMVE